MVGTKSDNTHWTTCCILTVYINHSTFLKCVTWLSIYLNHVYFLIYSILKWRTRTCLCKFIILLLLQITHIFTRYDFILIIGTFRVIHMHNESPTIDIQMVSIISSAFFFFYFRMIYHLFLQRFTQKNAPFTPWNLRLFYS